MFSLASKLLIGLAAIVATTACCRGLRAAEQVSPREAAKPAASARTTASHRTATIHWQRVPLRDAIGRLHALFDETVFVDRRVDPNMRVSLDIEAGSAEEVVAGIAVGRELGVAQVGKIVYLGPKGAAEQLPAISALRTQDVALVAADLRASLSRQQSINWPRLSEPRRVISSVVDRRGWRFTNADAIPHDLWPAGKLPGLTFPQQLTVLLIGFDLTFELRPKDRSIEVVAVKDVTQTTSVNATNKRSTTPPKASPTRKETRQVYTLRVKEQPVGALLEQLSKRLHWAIQIDEDSISKAGKSLDKRVSFSVENADQEHLLDAMLQPAGLDYRLDGERVQIIAGRYDAK